MRFWMVLLLSLVICPVMTLVAPASTPAPTLAPTVQAAQPHLDISAAPETLKVGDTVTITGVPVGIGLPYYTLTLSSGASVTVTYGDDLRSSAGDALFAFVAAHGEMNRVTFTLRALAPGSAGAAISATGEVRSAEGAFSWGSGTSPSLTLTVADS